MKKSMILLAAATGLLLAAFGSVHAYNGKLLNGKAVSVQYRGNACPCQTPCFALHGIARVEMF